MLLVGVDRSGLPRSQEFGEKSLNFILHDLDLENGSEFD